MTHTKKIRLSIILCLSSMGLNILSWPFLVSVGMFLSGMSSLYVSFDDDKTKGERLWYWGVTAILVLLAILVAKVVY
jgi:hypothetical protein